MFFSSFLRQISKSRSKASGGVPQETIETYYKELEKILNKNSIKDNGYAIYAINETDISLTLHSANITIQRDETSHEEKEENPHTMTYISAVNAVGHIVPPCFVFKGARESTVDKEMTARSLPGTKFIFSKTGRADSFVLLNYLKEHFANLVKQRPLILLYNGFNMNYTPDVISSALKEDIHLFVLPPHTSPTVFSPFQEAMQAKFQNSLDQHPDRMLTQEHLPALMTSAFEESMTKNSIVSGFKNTGLCPLNKDIVIFIFATENAHKGVRELEGKKEKDCCVCSNRKQGIRKRSRTVCQKCEMGLHGTCMAKHRCKR